MLSYRHSFHAGNHADVLKHVVLTEILRHLTRKETGISYIDTHAGAGLYNLESDHGQKLAEYNTGIGRLTGVDWPELQPYLTVLSHVNPPGVLTTYPGSPLFAQSLLRPQDQSWLFELHPTDHQLLSNHFAGHKKVRVQRSDGLAALPGLLPPPSRRGLVLIDPSYEIKRDYHQVVKALRLAHRRFATGVYALWYPVVDRRHIQQLEQSLKAAMIPHIQRFELGIAPDNPQRGMTASGMIVINPTWGLFDMMDQLLPKLAARLGYSGRGHHRCDILVPQ